MTKDFEYLEHTADIGVIAYGDDLRQLFRNAARGLFSIIVELNDIESKERIEIEVTAPDREALLVNWLNELIYIVDAKGLLLKDFDIAELTETRIKAKGYGEKIDIEKHHLKTQVKAATYHQLKIEQKSDGWRAQVIFDI